MLVLVRPTPQLAVELANQVQRRGRPLGSDQPPDLPEEVEDVSPRRSDQELVPILADVCPQKIEPVLD